jgi:NADPH:quinone reductase-like Zn-dependent oxidoreductase
MKAWALNGFGLEHSKVAERPVPEPTANRLLVRISAVSLNYQDKLLYDALHNPDSPAALACSIHR